MSLVAIVIGSAGLAVIACSFLMGRAGDPGVPPAGKATMEDVKRLIRAGQRIEAIRCYREIHQVSLAEAKDAVENLCIPE